jgi:DNA-binding NarL/FixJ family response regulator
MGRQRILLVDDHEVVRLGLKTLIDRQPGMEVVAEAATAAEAVTKALAHKPDVVVMDIRLAGDSGIDACREITLALPEAKVIMLTSYAEDEMLFAAIRAGATGYVLKQAGGQDVIRALNAVAEGHSLLDPALTERVFAEVRRAARAQDVTAFAQLTEQERRVLALLADGRTNREIASELHLGEGTVRNYVSNIFGKLGVSNRAEAAAYATKHNLRDAL